MRLKRRQFLSAATVLGVGAAAGPLVFSRRKASAWGEPAGFSLTDPRYRVLEIFVYGGLSPWETFYVRSDGDYADWFEFKSRFEALSWCGDGPGSSETRANGNDMAGNAMRLGPATKPLWDLRERLRILPVRHNLLPHEAAIPYALTGNRLGNPRLAGLGAHIQRFSQTVLPLSDSRPRSYVLLPPSSTLFDESRLVAMTATGMHPGSARPLLLRMGEGAAFRAALTRAGRGEYHDRLVDVYRDQYRRELRWSGSSIAPQPAQHRVLRSSGFDNYNAALEGVLHTADIEPIIDSDDRLTAYPTDGCGLVGGSPHAGMDYARCGINLAGHLFANDARYVGLVDVGLIQASTGGGYDTHPVSEHARLTSFNLHALLSALRDAVTAPAGGTPLIDLDDTLIVLNTEFGRTPYVGLDGGRDHHPEGYVMCLLGGPIGRLDGGAVRANAGVAGAMDGAGLTLDEYGGSFIGLTATDVMAAVLLAAGINPRSPEVFAAGDFSAGVSAVGDTDEQTMQRLASRVLGIPGMMP